MGMKLGTSRDDISFDFIYSFEVWVAPYWGNQTTTQKRIFTIE